MAPQVTSAIAVSSSSIQIDWEPSPLHDPETTDSPNSWLIEYTYITGQPLTLSLSNPNITTHTFLNLLKGTQYQVRVGGVNVRGVGMYSDYVTVATLSEAPSGGPANFAATSKSRTVTFSWSPPSIAHRNGVILSYTLTCTLQDNFAGQSSEHAQIINRVYHSADSHVLGGFRPFSTYNCSVLATNSAGNGPPVSLNVNTMDDSQLFQLRLIGIRCADWVITNAAQKAVQLASIITNAVQERCGMCDFSIDRITDGVFQCFSDSSEAVTYRALLHGTVELSALELLDFIEDWSENDESARAIRIDSVLLRIDRNCDVTITSKSDDECSGSDGESNSDNTLTMILAITFGILGGVVVVVAIFCVVCIIYCCYKFLGGSHSKDDDVQPYDNRHNLDTNKHRDMDHTDGVPVRPIHHHYDVPQFPTEAETDCKAEATSVTQDQRVSTHPQNQDYHESCIPNIGPGEANNNMTDGPERYINDDSKKGEEGPVYEDMESIKPQVSSKVFRGTTQPSPQQLTADSAVKESISKCMCICRQLRNGSTNVTVCRTCTIVTVSKAQEELKRKETKKYNQKRAQHADIELCTLMTDSSGKRKATKTTCIRPHEYSRYMSAVSNPESPETSV